MARSPWKNRDPLFRGEGASSVTVPTPSARISVVEHILYLGGRGRETPYTSTTESEEVAEHFAGPKGCIFRTEAGRAIRAGARHWSRKDLLANLRGFGKGAAKWTDAYEVAQAAQYVELWSEHLLDWRKVASGQVAAAVVGAFDRNR